jgi:glyoxylase-like metal-dependent hydrolase (beta-lactamase superfamily II)
MTETPANQPKLEIRIIPVTPLQQNTSMIWSTETMEGVFIDPGGEVDRLMDAARQFGVKIVAVWLTHGHLDHAGAAAAVAERTGCPVIGPHKFGVVHTPGHTPGHVVIYSQEGGLAFVGDVLFQGSIGRTDFLRGNHQQLIDSITGKLWPLGNAMRFVPGHGALSTFGQERLSNPFVADAVTGYQGAEKQAADEVSQKLSKRWS